MYIEVGGRMWSFIKWCAVLGFFAWFGYTVYDEATQRVKAAEAMMWYRNSQSENSDSGLKQEWQAYKDCVAAGDKPRDCVNF